VLLKDIHLDELTEIKCVRLNTHIPPEHINPVVFWPFKISCQFLTFLLILKICGLSGEAIANREISRFHEPAEKYISIARWVARIFAVTRFIRIRGYPLNIPSREKHTRSNHQGTQ